jgi:hypothetical protein
MKTFVGSTRKRFITLQNISVETQQQQQQQGTGVRPCLSTGQHSLGGRCIMDTLVTQTLFIAPESRLMLTQ